MALPVAIQLYSVRDEAAKDLEGTLKAISEMGYSGVEFASLYGRTPAEMKSLLKKYDLVPVSAHVSLDELLADVNKVIDDYSFIGCRFIAVPYLPDDKRPGTDAFLQTIEDIRKISFACFERGITLLYHNHDFEFVRIGGKYALDFLYKKIPASLLQTELDTCWVNVAGEKPVDFILKYSGRAPLVHLKDFVMKGRGMSDKLYELIGIENDAQTASDEEFGFRPVGYGVQDMPAILDASVKAGAQWVIVEQDRPGPGASPLESAKMSRDYLKTLGW